MTKTADRTPEHCTVTVSSSATSPSSPSSSSNLSEVVVTDSSVCHCRPKSGSPKDRLHSVRKSAQRLGNDSAVSKKSVLKMLGVMSENSPDSCRDVTQDFLTTGRVGRRNALPDILGEHALVSTSDLPDRLQGLSTKDDESLPGQSSQNTSSQMKSGETSGGSTNRKS